MDNIHAMESGSPKTPNVGSELLKVVERAERHSMWGRRAMGIMVLGAITAVYGLATRETQVFLGGATVAILAMGFLTHYTEKIINDNLLLKEAAKEMRLGIKK